MSHKKSVKKKALLLSEKPMKEQISYFTTLLESVEDKVKLIAEGHEALNTKMDNLSNKVESLSNDVQTVWVAVKSNKEEMLAIEKRLSEKIDRLADKVEYHDQEIRRLKTAISLN